MLLARLTVRKEWLRGQAWVQVALVLPLVLVAILAGLGYGLALYRWMRIGAIEATAVAWIAKGATPCQVYNGTVNDLELAGMDNPPTMIFRYHPGSGADSVHVCSVPSAGNCGKVPGNLIGRGVTVILQYPATSPVPLPGFGAQYLIVKRSGATVEHREKVGIPSVCP
jgi:hypothetical protein